MYGNTHGLLGSGRTTVKTALAAARGVFRIDSYGGDKNAAPAPATPPDAPVVIVQLLITTEKIAVEESKLSGSHPLSLSIND